MFVEQNFQTTQCFALNAELRSQQYLERRELEQQQTHRMKMREAFTRMSLEMEKAFKIAAREVQEAFDTARNNIQKTVYKTPIVCSSCEEKNAPSAVFCVKCGKKLSETSAGQTQGNQPSGS